MRDTPSAILLQFIGTFGVWILAEHIGLSGVLTVVCYAIAIARDAPSMTPARLRIPSYAVWETVVFLMNVLAFVLIGLQIRPILEPLEPAVRDALLLRRGRGAGHRDPRAHRLGDDLQRVLEAESARGAASARSRPMLPPTDARRVSRVVVRHARRRDARGGARAADRHAQITRRAARSRASTASHAAFPYRDLIVLTAFSVVIGTLVIQGLTLKPLLKLLNLRDDDPVGREADEARERAVRAALATLQGDDSPAAHAVRHEYNDLLARASHRAGVPHARHHGARRAAPQGGRRRARHDRRDAPDARDWRRRVSPAGRRIGLDRDERRLAR